MRRTDRGGNSAPERRSESAVDSSRASGSAPARCAYAAVRRRQDRSCPARRAPDGPWESSARRSCSAGLGFGADHAREAQLLEDVADLVHDLRDDVDAAVPLAPPGQREIDGGERCGAALQLELTCLDRLLEV